MNIINDRDKRTIYRRMKKRELDNTMNLSVSDGDYIRLLDEGFVVDAVGDPLFYIQKGTLRKFMDALPDDYVGSINIGHMEFATFPYLVGTWTKADLRLVDIGEGRMGLDVRPNLDDESIFIRELRRKDYTVGISAEFSYHLNAEASEKYRIDVLDEIFIGDFAIVGEAGNVNSSNIVLKGGSTRVDFKELAEALEKEGNQVESIEDLTKLLNAEAEETKEEPQEEAEEAEEAEEQPEEKPEEDSEEKPEEKQEEVQEEPEEEPEEDGMAQMAAIVEGLKAQVEELTAQVASLTAERDGLSEQLSARKATEKAFLEKFKALKVYKAEEEKHENKEESEEIIYTDGLGG